MRGTNEKKGRKLEERVEFFKKFVQARQAGLEKNFEGKVCILPEFCPRGSSSTGEKMGRQAARLKTCEMKFMYLFIKARSSMYAEVLS
jgi:hypothetical protein